MSRTGITRPDVRVPQIGVRVGVPARKADRIPTPPLLHRRSARCHDAACFNSVVLVLAILALARPASAGFQTFIALGDSGAFRCRTNLTRNPSPTATGVTSAPSPTILGARQGRDPAERVQPRPSAGRRRPASSRDTGSEVRGPSCATPITARRSLTQDDLLLTTIANETGRWAHHLGGDDPARGERPLPDR